MRKRLLIIPLAAILLAVVAAIVWRRQPHPQPVRTRYMFGTTVGQGQAISQATRSDGTALFFSKPVPRTIAPARPLFVNTRP